MAKYIPHKIIEKLTEVQRLIYSEKITKPSIILRAGTSNATKLVNPADNFLRQ
jgi:hypothetical protein